MDLADAGDSGRSDDDDDDIARFERQCAERARAEGLMGAAGQMDDESDEEEIHARAVKVSNGGCSPTGDSELRMKCNLLHERLQSRESELSQLRADLEMVKTEGDGPGDQLNSDLKQRLLELTKRNRRLTVTTESQRTKIQQLEAELKKPRENARKQADELAAMNSAAMLGDGLEDWKKKYLSASNKLQETRHEVQDLRAQLQRQRKVLLKELGAEDVVEKALAVADDPNSTQWRGRQAQVTQLQRQLRELREQAKRGGLAAEDIEPDAASDPGAAGRDAPQGGKKGARRDQASDKDRQGIIQAAERRREEFDKLQEETEKLRTEVSDLKHKREAAKSRKDILEVQVRELRTHVQTLVAKSENDDALVAAMRRQLGRPGGPSQDPYAGSGEDAQELREENAELKAQVERQAQIVLRLQQKNLEKSVEMGSTRLGPQGVEDAASNRELVERVRYLEAENAKQAEQVRLLRRHCGENPSGDARDGSGRPYSAEATLNLKERLTATSQKLAAAERENQVLRNRVEHRMQASPSGASSTASPEPPGDDWE